MGRIIILFIFSYSILGKPLHYLTVTQHLSGQNEQMSLLIYADKAELMLNTNRWTNRNYKIGKFILKDKKLLGKLYNQLSPLKADKKMNVEYSSAHSIQVSFSGKKILPTSPSYQFAISFFEIILRNYPWQAEHVHLYKNKTVTSLTSQKIKKKYNCFPNQVAMVCTGELGTIYAPFKKKKKITKKIKKTKI